MMCSSSLVGMSIADAREGDVDVDVVVSVS
jgi:hypothetical protein